MDVNSVSGLPAAKSVLQPFRFLLLVLTGVAAYGD